MSGFERMARRDGAAFRIDWFGSVGNSLQFGPKQRTLNVSCSNWDDGLGWAEGPAVGRHEIELPIAFLPMLRLGDVWQDGRNIGSAPLEFRRFEGLEVNESTAEVLPAGLPHEGSRGRSSYVLPFGAFTAHRNHTRSYVTRVQVSPAEALVVPSLELFRFYFGATGSVLERVMSASDDDQQRLYQNAYFSRTSRAANLVLGKGMPGAAASTVARIALDEEAKKAFFTLVKGGRLAAINGTDWHPRMSFPFAGKTNLTVAGLFLEGSNPRTFVALKLISCTYPHPFDRLYYSIDDGLPRSRPPAASPSPGR